MSVVCNSRFSLLLLLPLERCFHLACPFVCMRSYAKAKMKMHFKLDILTCRYVHIICVLIVTCSFAFRKCYGSTLSMPQIVLCTQHTVVHTPYVIRWLCAREVGNNPVARLLLYYYSSSFYQLPIAAAAAAALATNWLLHSRTALQLTISNGRKKYAIVTTI